MFQKQLEELGPQLTWMLHAETVMEPPPGQDAIYERDVTLPGARRNAVSLRQHDNWTVAGIIEMDYYTWVATFVAWTDHELVIGFLSNNVVIGSSWLAIEKFLEEYPLQIFDFDGI